MCVRTSAIKLFSCVGSDFTCLLKANDIRKCSVKEVMKKRKHKNINNIVYVC